jgi:hypothetical protein
MMYASAPKLLEALDVWEVIDKARAQQQLAALHARATREPDRKMLAVTLGANDLDFLYRNRVVSLQLVAPYLSQFPGVDAVATEKTVYMPRRGIPRFTRVAQKHLSSAATQNQGRIETCWACAHNDDIEHGDASTSAFPFRSITNVRQLSYRSSSLG